MVSPSKSMDFLARLLDAVATHLQIPREHLDAIDQQTRRDEGGERHYIASMAALNYQDRRQKIISAVESGLSPSIVAERFGVARQTVWRVTKKP